MLHQGDPTSLLSSLEQKFLQVQYMVFLYQSILFNPCKNQNPAVSTGQSQIQDRLIDPRTTRLARQQAARGSTGQGTLRNLENDGIFHTVPLVHDEQGILYSGGIDQPVSSEICHSFFPYSLSISPSDILDVHSGGIVQNELEIGAIVDDAVYSNDVNEVDCTKDTCNKRISCAVPERSAGRPGNRPIGARTIAHNSETCLGPYATRVVV